MNAETQARFDSMSAEIRARQDTHLRALQTPKPAMPRGVMNPDRAAKVAAKRIGVSVDEYKRRRAGGDKWCCGCKEWHRRREFGVNTSRSDGLENKCRKAVRAHNASYNVSLVATSPKSYYTGGRPANSTYTQIRERQDRGMSLPEIARDLGCSYWSIRRTVQRATQPEAYRDERAEQYRRLKARKPPWRFFSLDSTIPPTAARSRTWGDVIPAETVEDVAVREAAARLRAIVGDMEPEDVRLLDADSLQRLQDRLRDEGFAPRGVQQKERERLRMPDVHTGARIAAAPLIPGRKTRRQKIAHKESNRNRGNSNRPAKKPRKKWAA